MRNSSGILILVVTLIFSAYAGHAGAEEAIDPHQLLVEIDKNLWSRTKHIEGRLIIDNGRRVRTLTQETWMEGITKSYSFYKSPPRERGTKMLKRDRKLWMYTPQTDRKILIAGHLLRQSMMGSDLSYEDMMEDEKISEAYVGKVDRWEEYEGVKVLVMTLKAKDPSKTYQARRLWADPERKVVLREERIAKSGMLLKVVEYNDYRKINDRLFPKRMVFRDVLKENTKTTYEYDEIEFDMEIPARYFSQSILKR